MEKELISKKELLEMFSVSYGALYRWKRKGLIPEDWFIKKSTVTGQETFFPRDLIIERMELIKNQKDEFSLDDLSKQLVSEGEKKAFLIMDTAFGEKSFRLDEIKSIFVDDGDGHKTNVKEYLENIIRKNGGD